MANVNSTGARFAYCRHGGPASMTFMRIASDDGTATFLYDFLELAATGATGARPVQEVVQSTATGAMVGVLQGVDQFTGVSNANFNMYRRHRPASVSMYVHVITDTTAVFELQSEAAVALADIGLNADIVVGTGSTVSGISANELGATLDTTATRPVKVLQFVDRPDNEINAADNKVLVLINNHSYGSHTGTAGV